MTAPQKFTKKPVEIEAVQWDGTALGASRIIDWILANGGLANYRCLNPLECRGENHKSAHAIAIVTLEGTMYTTIDDWVIKGLKSEFYPCKPDIFVESYDPSPDHA